MKRKIEFRGLKTDTAAELFQPQPLSEGRVPSLEGPMTQMIIEIPKLFHTQCQLVRLSSSAIADAMAGISHQLTGGEIPHFHD